MLVREIMTPGPRRLRPDTAVDAAVRELATAHVSALPVVDEHDHVVGIVSEADVLRLQLAPDARAHLRPVRAQVEPWPETVRALMTPDAVTVPGGADVAEVAQLLADTGWKSVPVVEDGRLVGILSRSDVIAALATSDAAIRARLRTTLEDMGHEAWGVAVADGVVTLEGPTGTREHRLATALAAAVPGVRRVVVSG